jgi:hypothetical protein
VGKCSAKKWTNLNQFMSSTFLQFFFLKKTIVPSLDRVNYHPNEPICRKTYSVALRTSFDHNSDSKNVYTVLQIWCFAEQNLHFLFFYCHIKICFAPITYWGHSLGCLFSQFLMHSPAFHLSFHYLPFLPCLFNAWQGIACYHGRVPVWIPVTSPPQSDPC